ncbi:hypothetical protein [Achromobacter insolitus]|uniref:hypothetical protein n=1 Tax=Achromobacter insolitus TaxID=217204 RepID=UPI0007C3EFCF|nr:hypothetical protein [Achromobacter insolitus]OAD16471.1 hypothetical protein A3839_28390 [Achromobacter insolitus]
MQYSDEYVQEVIATGERLPVAMCELGMAEEILSNPVYDGSGIVEGLAVIEDPIEFVVGNFQAETILVSKAGGK